MNFLSTPRTIGFAPNDFEIEKSFAVMLATTTEITDPEAHGLEIQAALNYEDEQEMTLPMMGATFK